MPKEKDFERFTRVVLDEFKRLHERLDAIDDRFGRVEPRRADIETELTAIIRRLNALEEAVGSNSGYIKEVDDIRSRVRDIENHLGNNKKIAA
jgi:archaellum component FlaC